MRRLEVAPAAPWTEPPRSGRAKQAWGDLTDDDLAKVDGSYDRFVGVLQEKFGYTKEEAQQKIESEFGSGA